MIFACDFQVYLSLLPDFTHDIYDGIYFVWSIFHLFLRGISIAMSTILIHEYGHWPVKEIQKLKADHYDEKNVSWNLLANNIRLFIYSLSLKVRRFEKHLRYESIGLTGLGCFKMTRSFILGVSISCNIFDIFSRLY